jgi:hypothetical protein
MPEYDLLFEALKRKPTIPMVEPDISYRGMDSTPLSSYGSSRMGPPNPVSIPTATLPANPIPKRVDVAAGPKDLELPTTPKTGMSAGQTALASAPGILGLGLGIKQLFDSGNVKLEDTISQEDKDNLEEQRLRAASMRGPGYALGQRQKNIATTNTINAAAAGATGGEQAIQAALMAQQNANAFDAQQQAQGEALQQQNISKRQQLAQYIAQQRKQDLINKQQKEAALYEAGLSNVMGGVSGLASLAAGMPV